MRKIYFFIALISTIAVNAQQLPNNDFENWFIETYHSLQDYYDTGDEGSHNIIKSTDTQSGNFAVKLFTTANASNDFDFGFFINFDPDSFTGGIPYTEHVDSIKGYYKAHIVAQDTAWFISIFKNQGNIIGGETFPFTITENINTWTKFAFPTQMTAGVVPDTLMLGGVSSNALNEIGMEDGSWIMFDNIEYTSSGSPTTAIPNNSFENWDTKNIDKPTDFNSSLKWDISTSPLTVEKSTDASSGNYAVKLQTIINIDQDTISGAITNGKLGGSWPLPGGMVLTNIPNEISYDIKPNMFTADQAFVNFSFKKNGNIIHQVGNSYQSNAPTYIHEVFPINLTQPVDTLLFAAANGRIPGSSITIDNIVFHYPNGVDTYINAKRIEAFPNPATNKLNFEIVAFKENEISIEIIDISGKSILQKKYYLNKGKHKISLDISRLSKGNYLYSIKTKSSVFTHKFIKK